jgi:hypothetical protein
MSNTCKKRYIIKVPAPGATGPQGPQGPPGADGEVTLPISTDDVDYRGEVLTDVLDELLYQSLSIVTFLTAQTIFERGYVLSSLAVLWTYSKTIEEQTITGSEISEPVLAVDDRNVVLTVADATEDFTITLTADDVVGDSHAAKTATISLKWYDAVIWGVAASPGAYDSAFVIGLTGKQLRATRQGAFTLTVGVDQYCYICMPQDMGAATFKTNGFNGGLSLQAVISFTNIYGATKNYNIYRTENPSLGLTAFEIL